LSVDHVGVTGVPSWLAWSFSVVLVALAVVVGAWGLFLLGISAWSNLVDVPRDLPGALVCAVAFVAIPGIGLAAYRFGRRITAPAHIVLWLVCLGMIGTVVSLYFAVLAWLAVTL
jgi:hypothetical protein